jgi:hypothetical protein
MKIEEAEKVKEIVREIEEEDLEIENSSDENSSNADGSEGSIAVDED